MNNIIIIACTNVGRHIILEILKNKNIKSKISGVVNLNLKQSLYKSNYDSYHDIIKEYKIPILYVDNINEKKSLEWIKKFKPKIILQSGWSQKFSKELLHIPKYGCIGEHPAPLPYGRGAACVNWGLIKGIKNWGDTFFLMNNDYDNGPILSQKFFKIYTNDNVKTVYDKICFTSKEIVEENIDKWTLGKFNLTNQNKSNIVYFNKRYPEDGEIYLQENVNDIHNKIRALTKPYPGAFIRNNNDKIYIWNSEIPKKNSKIIKFLNSKELFVKFDKNLLLLKVGKKMNSVIKIYRANINNDPDIWGCELFTYFKKNRKLFSKKKF